MSVRAVTALVPARTGGVQFYRDADFYDADRDDLLVGDPYDPSWPDVPLRLDRRGSLASATSTVGGGPSSPSPAVEAPDVNEA